MEKFPRDAATVFSTLWKKQIDQDGSKHAALILEDVVDTSPYERILDWINLCVDEGNDIKFPDVSCPTASAAALLSLVFQSALSLSVSLSPAKTRH